MINYMDSWSISRFAGEVCGDPPKINNGKVQTDSTGKTGTVTAFYTCDKGFAKVGEEKTVCLSSGKWKKTTIKCGR